MTEPPISPSCDDTCCGLLAKGLTEVATQLSTRGFAALWEDRAVRPEELIPEQAEAAREAATALARAGRCEVDRGGRLIGIHGLSLRPTRHAFVHDGRRHHTWCAFDAVGIPAALAIDATVQTDCPNCQRQLKVTVTGGIPVAGQPLALWLPRPPTSNLMAEFCAAADLYCSVEHLGQEVGAAASGRHLDLDGAAVLGRHTWADLADLDLASVRR